MEQLSLYVPGIMGLAFALVAFLSVRHIAGHRPEIRRASSFGNEEERPLPFDEPAPSEPTPEMRLLTKIFHQ